MKISVTSIYNDLLTIQEKLGQKFLLTLCATIIFSFTWWDWSTMRDSILNDEEFNKNNKELNNGN